MDEVRLVAGPYDTEEALKELAGLLAEIHLMKYISCQPDRPPVEFGGAPDERACCAPELFGKDCKSR